jgi:hypothetical protein
MADRAATRRAVRSAARWAGLAIAVLLAGCTPQPMTEQARQTHWLYNLFMACAAGVFVIVGGLIMWSKDAPFLRARLPSGGRVAAGAGSLRSSACCSTWGPTAAGRAVDQRRLVLRLPRRQGPAGRPQRWQRPVHHPPTAHPPPPDGPARVRGQPRRRILLHPQPERTSLAVRARHLSRTVPQQALAPAATQARSHELLPIRHRASGSRSEVRYAYSALRRGPRRKVAPPRQVGRPSRHGRQRCRAQDPHARSSRAQQRRSN